MKWLVLTALLLLLSDSQAQKSWRLRAVGDIMLGTNFPDSSYLPPSDGQFLLDSVKPFLLDADITFGNLEGTYFNGQGKVKKCKDPERCYAFRSPEHYLGYIQDAGFDVVSLANNHSGDFGDTARKRTMELCDSLNLAYAGLLDCPTTVFYTRDSLRIGFAAFAPNSGCVSLLDIENAEYIVRRLKNKCDVVLISFHGGAEGARHQHVPDSMEIFLEEERGDLRQFSHRLIDAGADIVLGHGPHVSRGIELYKNRLIAYSLGNFATWSRFNLKGPNGICPILEIEFDEKGEFLKGWIIPVKQIGEGIPVLDRSGAVISSMRELSLSDFPESPLRIYSSGKIAIVKKPVVPRKETD